MQSQSFPAITVGESTVLAPAEGGTNNETFESTSLERTGLPVVPAGENITASGEVELSGEQEENGAKSRKRKLVEDGSV